MEKEEKLHKEIDLVQGVIERMASNSFNIKAWTIAIVGGVLALGGNVFFPAGIASVNSAAGIGLGLFLLVVVIVFWYLDGFFLKTEKLYRNLYRWILDYRPQTEAYLYDLNTFTREVDGKETKITAPSIFKVMFTKTLWPFYIIPLLFVGGLMVYVCMTGS
jgi:hypothetical protein